MDDYDDFNSTRTRWLRIGAIGLGAVVLAAAAFGVGRWSAPASGGGQPTTVSSQSGPGPWRVENGVPVGYAHTPDGAVAAATNYVMVFEGPLMAQPEKYRTAINTLSTPTARAALQGEGQNQQKALQTVFGLLSSAQEGRIVVLRTIPLTYHVDRYDVTVAQVSIWAETMAAVDGSYAPHMSWATGTCTVEWVAGDWRLVAIDRYPAGPDGPTPITGQATVQAGSLPVQLKDFKEYRHDGSP